MHLSIKSNFPEINGIQVLFVQVKVDYTYTVYTCTYILYSMG